MSLYVNRKKDKDYHSLIKLSLIKVLKASHASKREENTGMKFKLF